MDYIQGIISGLLGGLVVYILMLAGKKPAQRQGGRRVLTFGLGFKLLIPGFLLIAYVVAFYAHPSQYVLALCIAGAFLIMAVWLAYEAFFVQLSYDNDNIYYNSPLVGSHQVPWTQVQGVGYSRLMQSYFICTPYVSRIWLSSMLLGYEELGEFLNNKYEELHSAPR